MSEFVAWTMFDGHVMCGRVRERLCGTAYIVRVDGSSCTVAEARLRPASYDDVMSACRFFVTIGK